MLTSIHLGGQYLPRDLEIQVNALGRKEAKNILLERGLEILIEDDIFPIRLLDLLPQPWVLVPETLVEDPDLVVRDLGPASCGNKQVLAGLLGRAFVDEELVREGRKTVQVLQNIVSRCRDGTSWAPTLTIKSLKAYF